MQNNPFNSEPVKPIQEPLFDNLQPNPYNEQSAYEDQPPQPILNVDKPPETLNI